VVLGWTLGNVLFFSALVLQVTIVAFVLTGRRVTIEGLGIALVLGIGAVQSGQFLFVTIGIEPDYHPTLRYLDTALLATVAFLLTRYPNPLGSDRVQTWTRRIWLGLLAIWLPVSHVLYRVSGGREGAYRLLDQILHEAPFAIGAGLIALHIVPRIGDRDPGPLRSETLLVGAGLGVGLAYRVGNWIAKYSTAGVGAFRFRDPTVAARIGLQLVTAWFVVAAVARLVAGLVHRRPERDDAPRRRWLGPGLLASFFFVGGLAGGWAFVQRASPGPVELAPQLLRPVLLGVAILRFSTYELPTAHRRVLVPFALVAFTCLAYLFVVSLFNVGDLDTQGIPPVSGLASAALVAAGVFVFQEPLAKTIQPGTDPGRREDRLRRYRVALERHRAGGIEAGELAEIRRELGVEEAEHQALAAILDENLVVPTDLVHGAKPGALVAGRFEVQRVLGEGGQGRALLARDREADELVVLKELVRPWEADAEDRAAELRREAQAAARVDDDRVASVRDSVEEGRRLYLVREFVPGRTLADVLDEEGALPGSRVRDLLVDVAEGLAAIHEAGLVHGDLKPENVVIDDDGRARLIDLGTARSTPDSDEATITLGTPESDGGGGGTLAWMAPEQIEEGDVESRTDLFALGAIGYRALAGEHHVPLEDQPAFHVERAIVEGKPPSLSDEIDVELHHLVEQCLVRDPERRPASVDALRQQIP